MVGLLIARVEHSQREGTECDKRTSEVTNGNTTNGDTWIRVAIPPKKSSENKSEDSEEIKNIDMTVNIP